MLSIVVAGWRTLGRPKSFQETGCRDRAMSRSEWAYGRFSAKRVHYLMRTVHGGAAEHFQRTSGVRRNRRSHDLPGAILDSAFGLTDARIIAAGGPN